jgi:hypothetical protein
VVLRPGAVAATVALLDEHDLDLVCPCPRQLAVTAAERLVQPLLQWSWLTFLPLRLAERSPRESLSAANGQLLAVRRAKHELARGFETERDFPTALALEDSRLVGEIEKMAADVTYESHAHRHHAYRRRGEYAEQLERVFALFPRERVHVLDSESYFAEPEREYAALLEFLDLEPYTPARFDRHNARPSKPMPPAAKEMLTAHYAQHEKRLTDLLGRPPRWAAGS